MSDTPRTDHEQEDARNILLDFECKTTEQSERRNAMRTPKEWYDRLRTGFWESDIKSIQEDAQKELRAEVERLRSRIEWFEKSGCVTAHTAYFQMEHQRDQWRDVAHNIVECVKIWNKHCPVGQSIGTNALAAYERLVKGETK